MGIAEAATLQTRAKDANNRGRPAVAVRLLDRALAEIAPVRGGDRDRLEAEIWISRALVDSEIRGASAAEPWLARAQERAGSLNDPALLVHIHSQRAQIAIRAGQLSAALAQFEQAEPLIEYANRDAHFGILLNSGNLYLYQGMLAPARRALGRAAEYARSQNMPDGAFKSLHNLGYLEFLAGDLPRALRLMADAGEIDTDVSRGVWLLDRARVLAEAGLTSEADRSLAAAAAILRHDRIGQDLAETELERARCALIIGDIPTARRFAMNARDRFRRRGNDRWRRQAELVLLAGDLAAGRPGSRLIAPAERLRDEFTREGARLPARSAALLAAEAYLAAGRPDAARDTLAGLGRAARSDPITARLHNHYVRARLDLAVGRSGAAVRRVGAALAELAEYQAGFGSIDLATAAAVHGRRLAELDLGVALATGRADRVLGAAERSRAVLNRLPAVHPPDDPELAELLAELRQTVEALRADGASGLQQRRAELERRIAARGWTRSRSRGGTVAAVVGLDDLRADLGDTTLLSFVRHGPTLHTVVCSTTTLRLGPVAPADEVDELIRRIRADLDVLARAYLPPPVRDAVSTSSKRSLARLDALLVAPVGRLGRVVVVSTGLLGQVPWGLLPSLREVPVVVAPSATAWYAAQRRAASGRRRVVALSGPGLDRAEAEATAVAGTWPRARAVLGADGRTFVTALADTRILHVAAHGVHESENPLFSCLRLADGPLFAHELDQNAAAPDHVVLSACELGLATVRPGDEALGLTSVLLHLGTRSVVAGVARVGDEPAAELMDAYHTRLRAGDDSAAALAGALTSHPAPIVCFGAEFAAR